MARLGPHPTRGETLRAALLTAAAIAGAVLTWRLRPGTAPASTAPDADVVLACAWLAWVLAGYLCVAVAASAAGHLAGGFGRAGRSVAWVAPARLRRLVDSALTLSVAAALVGGPAIGAASAAVPTHTAQRIVSGSPLDWPGLTPVAAVHTAPATPRSHAARPPDGPGPPAPSTTTVVVQPGDTLWTIAARGLGPGASGGAITAAWHAWYAANRAVIGDNPSVIHPGQRLVPPTTQRQPARIPSTSSQPSDTQ